MDTVSVCALQFKFVMLKRIPNLYFKKINISKATGANGISPKMLNTGSR